MALRSTTYFINAKCCYADQPSGINKVTRVVKEICKFAGIEGKFTNHSLRATSVSIMFQNDVLEWVIKEITGHRSDCVHTYRRTSDEIHQHESNIISVSGHKSVTISIEDEQQVCVAVDVVNLMNEMLEKLKDICSKLSLKLQI